MQHTTTITTTTTRTSSPRPGVTLQVKSANVVNSQLRQRLKGLKFISLVLTQISGWDITITRDFVYQMSILVQFLFISLADKIKPWSCHISLNLWQFSSNPTWTLPLWWSQLLRCSKLLGSHRKRQFGRWKLSQCRRTFGLKKLCQLLLPKVG